MTQQVVLKTKEMQLAEARLGRPIDAFLHELYVEQGLTVEEVGAALGITKGAASRWLERFGIRTRRGGPRRISEEEVA